MLKKLLAVLAVVAVVALAGALMFTSRYRRMARVIENTEIENIDLSQVPNGVYAGAFGEFVVGIELKVHVEDHRITAIDVVSQKAGKGYEGLETIDWIISSQSLDVDAVTGATGSSKVIRIAVQNALRSAPRVEPMPVAVDSALADTR